MLKLCRIILFCVVTFLVVGGSNVFANIFASLVEVDFDGNFPASISYTLNEWATSVVITIKQNDVAVKTINIGLDENGSFKGPNSVLWDGSLDDGGAAGNGIYTIEIFAVDDIGHYTWELLSMDIGPDNWFWSSAGVAANRRQTSPYFGMIYVCERSGDTSSNPDAILTVRGLYLFNSFALYWGFQQATSYAEGNSVFNWIPFGDNAPLSVTIGPDDRVYLSALGTTGSEGGVVAGDGLFSATGTEEILALHDLSNHGAVSRAAVTGNGADRVMYTCEQIGESTDFDPQTLSPFTTSVLRRYRLGESSGLFTGEPEDLLTDVLTRPFDVDFDSQGFMYVIQNESSENAIVNDVWGLSKWDISVNPPLEIWHVPVDTLPPSDYVPVGLLPRQGLPPITSPSAPATNFDGIGIDEPRNRVYVARRGANQFEAGGPIYQVLQFAMDSGEFQDGLDTSVNVYIDANGDTVVEDLGTSSSRGYNQRDVGVDAAGNVISVNSNTEALRVYSPPDGPNSFLTYSPWAIQVGGGEPVIPTPVVPPTHVAENVEQSAPSGFRLFQNYPNPFNGSTLIKYRLSKNLNVNLKIYDLLGREVATLVDGKQDQGLHLVHWDGTNNLGQMVTSGIYLYEMRAGNFVEIKKLTYLR